MIYADEYFEAAIPSKRKPRSLKLSYTDHRGFTDAEGIFWWFFRDKNGALNKWRSGYLWNEVPKSMREKFNGKPSGKR